MSEHLKGLSYRKAGVDIDAQDEAIRRLRPLAKATHTPEVLADIGTFGALFHLSPRGYRDPVLVASTDGVGTKLQVAVLSGIHDTIGYDLVSHCINDILVQGAFPLFFMDYFATGKLDPEVVEAVLKGVTRACGEFGCPLIGGELAEMGAMYKPGDYDIAGFIVGAVERDRLLTGASIEPGDVILGLGSTGLHTNGYSLARKVLLDRMGLSHDSTIPDLGETVAGALLAPHRCYLPAMREPLEEGVVKGMAHITGGGITDNVPRILPEGCTAVVSRSSITVPPIFELLGREGAVERDEMWRTFNMGIGMAVVVAEPRASGVARHLEGHGETVTRIGRIEKGPRRVTYRD